MIIFVADAFKEHYVGGAELTTEAIIEACLLPSAKVLSSHVDVSLMKANKDKFWVFGNFHSLDDSCKLYAIKNLSYSVLEYDYKFCEYRSPEKHAFLKDQACDCHKTNHGKLTAAFLAKAKINWWMSEEQKKAYQKKFPFLKGEVLSSVFCKETLEFIDSLVTERKKDTWLILNSKSWIKGVEDAVQYAEERNLKYELVWGLEYKDLLRKMAESKGLIFLPKAGDTCPRLVIEAKLLGCELILNDNVQHKNEEWFKTRETCMDYMRDRTTEFWSKVEQEIDFLPTENGKLDIKYYIISPFYNAERYIKRCIDSIKQQSHQDFECILIDDISTDNSYNVALEAIGKDERFKIVKNKSKHFALKNIHEAIKSCGAREKDVIILLDGDDWLSSKNVLGYLNTYYQNKECWMTYGSYVMYPHGVVGPEPSAYPEDIVSNNLYRQDQWRASHLRTFRKHVWDNIDTKDLKDAEGNFYKMAYDQAIMLPLLEMSGEKCHYLNKILHVYNKENPLNVDKLKAEEQVRTANEIRQKTPYKRLF